MTNADRLSANAGRGKADRVLFILGDQLDADAAALDRITTGKDVVLFAEVADESTHAPSHKQRTVLFLSAMRHFATDLQRRGHRVRYVKINDPHTTHTLAGEARRAIDMYGSSDLMLTLPGEHRLREQAERWDAAPSKGGVGARVTVVEDEHFLVPRERFAEWADGKKQLVMEFFYRQQRKRLGVLVDDEGKPEGGAWNFDKENRKALKRAPRPEPPFMPEPDDITTQVIRDVNAALPDLPGRLDQFRWTVTAEDARTALDHFIEHKLHRFGTYQDAMWTDEPFLYHAQLSHAINLKLLPPMEPVDAALDAYRNDGAPLNAVEGFVRQLIGWREFIRGVYDFEGPDYLTRNHLDHHGNLPDFYWTADTDMHCMHQSLTQVLDHAYGHHIQRLMVTGNFALIAGVEPAQVNDWYLGMYIDAVDWATAPNVLGMALHADGGVVGTKPYAASGKYINRMSNYCDQCRYDPNKRTGEDACPFNTLYWDFLVRHRHTFKANSRMAMIMKNAERLPKSERADITVEGSAIRDRMGITP